MSVSDISQNDLERVIERAYEFGDLVRKAIGKRRRQTRGCGSDEACPLEAHINDPMVGVGAGYITLWGGAPSVKRSNYANGLLRAGFRETVDCASYRQFVKDEYRDDLREFVRLTDQSLSPVPAAIRGRWNMSEEEVENA